MHDGARLIAAVRVHRPPAGSPTTGQFADLLACTAITRADSAEICAASEATRLTATEVCTRSLALRQEIAAASRTGYLP